MTEAALTAATCVRYAPYIERVRPRPLCMAACGRLKRSSISIPKTIHNRVGTVQMKHARRWPRKSLSLTAFTPESYDVVDEVSNIPLYVAAVAGIVVGLGAPILYEFMGKKSDERDNEKPCFPCDGTGRLRCRVCDGKGKVEIDIGGDKPEINDCVNCDGSGQITCTTCQGNGIQPRYLERREFVDND